MYNWILDTKKWVKSMISPNKRHAVRVALYTALFTPILNLWTELVNHYNVWKAYILPNLTTDNLQANLRTQWAGNSSGHIYVITTCDQLDQFYLWPVNSTAYDFNTRLFNTTETGFSNTKHLYTPAEFSLTLDYTIIIPTVHAINEAEIVAYCNRYKVAGKRFNTIINDIP